MPKASRRLSLAVGEAGANIQGKSESEAAKKLSEIYQKFYDSGKNLKGRKGRKCLIRIIRLIRSLFS